MNETPTRERRNPCRETSRNSLHQPGRPEIICPWPFLGSNRHAAGPRTASGMTQPRRSRELSGLWNRWSSSKQLGSTVLLGAAAAGLLQIAAVAGCPTGKGRRWALGDLIPAPKPGG